MITVKQLKLDLNNGALDAKLSNMYCRPVEQMVPYRNRICVVADGYMQQFSKDENAEIAVYSAPGRTELGGNHTDHQHGKVLTASVDLDAIACAAPNGTDTVNVYSCGYGMTSISCMELDAVASEENSTAALIRGIMAKISSFGYKVSGFDAYVTSDVPGGSGLSSSACIEILLGVIVNELFCGGELDSAEIAKIGQFAENVYFGKPSGLLDQMGCAVGNTVTIDFADPSKPVYQAVDFPFTTCGYAMCIIDSGADHADLTGDYAAITVELKNACRVFGKEYLRDVPEDEFYSRISEVRAAAGDRAVLRAIHIYEDNKRVDLQVEALKKGDFEEFLTYVNKSGSSSWRCLQNVVAAGKIEHQEVAVTLAVTEHLLGGRGACRVHGGGFAGAIQAFVPVDMLDSFKAKADAVFGENACRVTYIRPVGGCVITD